MKPKNWIIEKNCTVEEQRAINNGASWSVEKETEKAYLFKASTDFGNIHVWCPKSQIEDNSIIVVDGKKYVASIYYRNHPEARPQ